MNLQIQELKDHFVRLGNRFLEESEKLINPGTPPDAHLLEDLASQTQSYMALGEALKELAREWSWEGSAGDLDSLAGMDEYGQGLARHLEEIYRLEKRERETRLAQYILTRAQEITTSTDSLTAEIEAIQEKMHACQDVLARSLDDPEAAELSTKLLAGDHPAAALLRLAENHLELRNTAELFQQVQEEYGILLAIAAIKGELHFPEPDRELLPEDAEFETPWNQGEQVEQEEEGEEAEQEDRDDLPLLQETQLEERLLLAPVEKEFTSQEITPFTTDESLELKQEQRQVDEEAWPRKAEIAFADPVETAEENRDDDLFNPFLQEEDYSPRGQNSSWDHGEVDASWPLLEQQNSSPQNAFHQLEQEMTLKYWEQETAIAVMVQEAPAETQEECADADLEEETAAASADQVESAWESDSPDGPSAQEEEEGRTLEKLDEQIYNLIQEKHLDPAYWLIRYAEKGFAAPPPVPSALLRALEFSQIVEGDGGPASLWLSHVYRQDEFKSLVKEEPAAGARGTAEKLLTFASLVRPALVAPGTLAPAMLEKMVGLPLYLEKICAVLSPWNADISTEEKNMAEQARELLDWHRQTKGKGLVSSHQVVQVWEEMQQEDGVLYELLRPIVEKDYEVSEGIPELIRHLKDEENMQGCVTQIYRSMQYLVGPLDFFEIPDSWQLLSRFREVVKLAESWMQQIQQSQQVDAALQEESSTENNSEDVCLGTLIVAAREGLQELATGHPEDRLMAAAISFCEDALLALDSLRKQERPAVKSAEKLVSLEVSKNNQLRVQPPWEPGVKELGSRGEKLLELLKRGDLTGAAELSAQFIASDENHPAIVDTEDLEENPVAEAETPSDEGLDYLEQTFKRRTLNSRNKAKLSRFSVFSRKPA